MLEKLKFLGKPTPKQPTLKNLMSGINSYGEELPQSDICENKHRDFIGGKWEEIGQLQFNFLLETGLQPHHKLLDLGCGCLRGGIHFISYLEADNYYGLDVNASLIEAAWREVKLAQLEAKNPQLLVNDKFEIERFGQQFDFMLSISVFTHLPMNMIIRCLSEVQKNLTANGKYYSTFFVAPSSAHTKSILHQPGGITTNYDFDPFHYSVAEISFMAQVAGLGINIIGEWNHPRNQQMVEFFRL